MRKRFTTRRSVGFLGEADAGIPLRDFCRMHGFSLGSCYVWRIRFGRKLPRSVNNRR